MIAATIFKIIYFELSGHCFEGKKVMKSSVRFTVNKKLFYLVTAFWVVMHVAPNVGAYATKGVDIWVLVTPSYGWEPLFFLILYAIMIRGSERFERRRKERKNGA